MSVITVWKCDHTGKLFEDQAKYKSHLSRLARERRVRKSLQLVADEQQAWWDAAQNTEMSLDELKQFILNNQSKFWQEAANSQPGWCWADIGKKTRKGVVMPIPKLTEFTEFRLKWSDSVSNSHGCPKGGVTNWGGRTTLKDGSPAPRGYPGWTGRMDWRIEWPKEFDGSYPGSDLFKGRRQCIRSGSGGGGGWQDGLQSFGYGIEIFAADWTGMFRQEMRQQWIDKENQQRQKAWRALGGQGSVALVDCVPDNWVAPDVWKI